LYSTPKPTVRHLLSFRCWCQKFHFFLILFYGVPISPVNLCNCKGVVDIKHHCSCIFITRERPKGTVIQVVQSNNKFKLEMCILLNSFRTAHERMLVCRVLFCRPRTSLCTFVTCTYIFTLANSFSDFFLIKSARKVSDHFLPHILNIWIDRFPWIFLLF
jgi:hypothetical protein